MTAKFKITGKTKWVKPDGKYVNSYALEWSTPAGKQETIATMSYFLDGWTIWISPKYSDKSYVSSFDTKRDAKAYIERYFGIVRKNQPRSKDWHPFGL